MTIYTEQQKQERGYYSAARDYEKHKLRMRWWLLRARRLRLARKDDGMDEEPKITEKELKIADAPLQKIYRSFKHNPTEHLTAARTADLLKALTSRTRVKR